LLLLQASLSACWLVSFFLSSLCCLVFFMYFSLIVHSDKANSSSTFFHRNWHSFIVQSAFMINVKSKKSIGISCNTTSDKVGKSSILFSKWFKSYKFLRFLTHSSDWSIRAGGIVSCLNFLIFSFAFIRRISFSVRSEYLKGQIVILCTIFNFSFRFLSVIFVYLHCIFKYSSS
jgi:hypothetical protein